MRRVRCQMACSLDGFIAGPGGDVGWIPSEPAIDFRALFDQFDTLLMGRRTYEGVDLSGPPFEGKRILVFSRTLTAEGCPGATLVAGNVEQTIGALRAGTGKDIWLFGGGELFRTLLDLCCVDTVEPALVPVLLGGGRPLLPSPALRQRLVLTGHRVFPGSGIVLLTYEVLPRSRKQP